MKRIFSFLLLLSALPILQGCITDTKKENPEITEAGPNGERKPRTPKVTYTAIDSLVSIQITGSGTGQENAYWIRRDGTLLEQPSHQSGDPVQNLYVLVDSLTEIGVHKYYVQYGTHPDSLSEKSPEFVYDYAGHSRSGRVSVQVTPEQLVSVSVLPPGDELLGAFIVERKIGSAGRVIVLDTIEVGSPNPDGFENFLDTALVPEDVYLYYRVKALDAITEEYLPPSPWDSVLVKNKVWKYLPSVQFAVSETGIQIGIFNPLNYPDNGTAYYFLYRNATAEKDGRSKVDSLPISALFLGAGLNDRPDPGDYYYWVEARDPWGRVSARSTPKFIHFTGRAAGPGIQVTPSGDGLIHVQPYQEQDAAYYIIQRAQDTTKAPTTLDTVAVSFSYPFYGAYIDRPTADGVYFYRIISIRANGEESDPGPWATSGFFHYDPVFAVFSAPIVNRGDRVQCQVDRISDYYYILYRSKYASGPDTAAVDTLWYSDAATLLVDTPPIGTWYYRVQRIPTFTSTGTAIYRTLSTRIDFTGKPVGPPVTGLSVYPSRIDIFFTQDPEGLAYILERSVDGKDWNAADTVSALDVSGGVIRNKPPTDGFWSYRLLTMRKDMSVSGPGTPMRSPTPFTYAQLFDNSLFAYVENKGTRLDFPMYYEYGYVFYLLRSDKGDWKDGQRVDSLKYNDSRIRLSDSPPKGVWFYWIQREPIGNDGNEILSRSNPIRVEFTGSLEISSISKSGLGLQINFPYVSGTDSLEIYRSTGNPEDLAGYSLLGSVASFSINTYYRDATVANKTGIYHYRIATKTAGVRSELGAPKSVYFDATAVSGQVLIKRASAP
jgi:hypothetical protein